MVVAEAVAAIALGLLGASGVVKLIDPDPTTGAMGAAGLPSSSLLSRLLGTAELVAAIVGFLFGGIGLVPASVLYLGFTLFTVLALRGRFALQSCGCFGREDTPPTGFHVAFNTLAVAALTYLALLQLEPIHWGLPPIDLALYLVWLVLGVGASFLLLARVPQVLAFSRSQ